MLQDSEFALVALTKAITLPSMPLTIVVVGALDGGTMVGVATGGITTSAAAVVVGKLLLSLF